MKIITTAAKKKSPCLVYIGYSDLHAQIMT